MDHKAEIKKLRSDVRALKHDVRALGNFLAIEGLALRAGWFRRLWLRFRKKKKK
jgi:hypothetical protein